MEREDEIRTIAYRIWEDDGRYDGHDLEYWLKAEAIWEDEQKNVLIVTKTKSKQTVKRGGRDKPASSTDVPAESRESQRIHKSLVLKVLGQ